MRRRVSAVVEVQPFLSVAFIAFTVRCLQEFVGGSPALKREWDEMHEPGSSSSTSESGKVPWRDYAKARTFALKLLRRLASHAAPMLIIWTAYQLVVIERSPSSDLTHMEIDIHTTVLAQPGPEPPVEPTDEAAQALLSDWTFSLEHNLVAQLTLLAARADRMEHPFKPINIYEIARPLTEVRTSAVEERAPRQLSASHTLLYHCDFFAISGTSEVHHTCIVPSNEQHCEDLLTTGLGALSAPCSNPLHVRAIVKTPRTVKLEEEFEMPRIEGSSGSLEDEAKSYEALEQLQGSVLPVFYGRWKVDSHTCYAYENVGVAVSRASQLNHFDAQAKLPSSQLNRHGLEAIQLTVDEKRSAKAQFKDMLEQLHAAGYAHNDITGRNLCVRRIIDEAGVSQLRRRLIDLSETDKLSKLSEEDQATYLAQDIKNLEHFFAQLDKHNTD